MIGLPRCARDRAKTMNIGVPAIQGDYEAHKARLEELGCEVTLARQPAELDDTDAVGIPSGESTTFRNILAQHGFLEEVLGVVASKPAFGTCAGAILLAKEVENPPQTSLGVLDIRVRRNGYGRQNDSSIREARTLLGDPP